MFQKIAPLCYLTPLGLFIAGYLYLRGETKKPVDIFHIRQSTGLYFIGLLCMIIFYGMGSNLLYADLPSLIVLTPLFIFWLMGFNSAMNDKVKTLPLIGRYLQRAFAFIK